MRIGAGILAAIVGLAALSCTTGIESTKPVVLTREDKRQLKPSAEELFMADIVPGRLTDMSTGELFYVAPSESMSAILVPSEQGDGGSMPRRVVYSGLKESLSPDGISYVKFIFRDADDPSREYLYDNAQRRADLADLTTDFFIGLTDSRLLKAVKAKLEGMEVWTRTEYSDRADAPFNAPRQKYVKIRFDSVTPGDINYPLKVWWTDSLGYVSSLPLSVSDGQGDNRHFDRLFSLTDPHLRYSHISDDMWSLIKEGRIVPGMTKEEVKLSKGTPKEVNAGRDYHRTIDIWQYSNGLTLRFEDGLLVNIM